MPMPRLRRPSIPKMTNTALLAEFASAHSWFVDGFSLSQPSRHDYARADRVRAEIIRRMGSPATTPTAPDLTGRGGL